MRYTAIKIVKIICQKLLSNECFFGKKNKQGSLEEMVNQQVKAKAALGALMFLLHSDEDLVDVEYTVGKKKAHGLGKMVEKSWAMKYMKYEESNGALTKDLRANMPTCVELMYADVKADAMKNTMQLVVSKMTSSSGMI